MTGSEIAKGLNEDEPELSSDDMFPALRIVRNSLSLQEMRRKKELGVALGVTVAAGVVALAGAGIFSHRHQESYPEAA